ncbi:hypothetical protein AGIG_G25390 [Arapaima gigas]
MRTSFYIWTVSLLLSGEGAADTWCRWAGKSVYLNLQVNSRANWNVEWKHGVEKLANCSSHLLSDSVPTTSFR